MAGFDLATNPFNVLGVSLRSTQGEIASSVEDAQFDGRIDEHLLLQAHQQLSAPRTRLEAELGWMPEVSPARAKAILSKLVSVSAGPPASDEFQDVVGLARANLFATLASRYPGTPEFIVELIAAHVDLSGSEVLGALNDNRSISGYSSIDKDLFNQIFPNIVEAHARTASESICKAEHPGNLMTEIVEEFLTEGRQPAPFLDDVVHHYDSWSMPALRAIKDKIDEQVDSLRSDPEEKGPVDAIVKLLVEWDEFSQACQLIQQAKGLNEQRSKDLYQELRDICLWLSNEEGQHTSALKISKALLDTFPELPTVVVQSSADIEALEELVEEAESVTLFASFLTEFSDCKSNLSAFDSELIKCGFSNVSGGQPGRLFGEFLSAARASVGGQHADVPWMLVRSLAIELNNEEDSPEGALSVLRGLKVVASTVKPSDKVKDLIKGDLSTIRANIKFRQLARAAEQGDWTTSLSLANELLNISNDPEEIAVAQKIKSDIEAKLRGRKAKRIFWGLVAAGIAVFWIVDEVNKNQRRASYSSNAGTYFGNNYSPPPTKDIPKLNFNDLTPSKPQEPLRLSEGELRYCLFTQEKMNYLRSRIHTPSASQSFNALVHEWNSRCDQRRYSSGLGTKVKAELQQEKWRLQMEAETLLSRWNSAPAGLIGPKSETREQPTNRPAPTEIQEGRLLSPSNQWDARTIQHRLKELGYYDKEIDGLWGAGSWAALREFRLRNGLSSTDSWDHETQRRLFLHRKF